MVSKYVGPYEFMNCMLTKKEINLALLKTVSSFSNSKFTGPNEPSDLNFLRCKRTVKPADKSGPDLKFISAFQILLVAIQSSNVTYSRVSGLYRTRKCFSYFRFFNIS